MSIRDRLRVLMQLNRGDGPHLAVGGQIRPGAPSDDESGPYLLSPGYVFVHGRSIGVDHDGPVVVEGDDWAPLARDDRPEWMTEASWCRLKEQGQ